MYLSRMKWKNKQQRFFHIPDRDSGFFVTVIHTVIVFTRLPRNGTPEIFWTIPTTDVGEQDPGYFFEQFDWISHGHLNWHSFCSSKCEGDLFRLRIYLYFKAWLLSEKVFTLEWGCELLGSKSGKQQPWVNRFFSDLWLKHFLPCFHLPNGPLCSR